MTERESRRTRRRSRTWPRVPHHGSRQRRGQYSRARLRMISIDASGRRNDHGGERVNGAMAYLGEIALCSIHCACL